MFIIKSLFNSVCPTDYGIAAFGFTNLSGCTQLIRGLMYKLSNCLDLVLINAPGVEDPLVDPHF